MKMKISVLSKKYNYYPAIWLLYMFMPVIFLMAYRAWRVDEEKRMLTSCAGCFLWPTISSDLWILGSLIFLIFLALIFKNYIFRLLIAGLGFCVLVFFIADIFVKAILAHRLYIADLINYGGEVGAQLDMVGPFFSSWEGLVLLVASFLSILFFTRACFLNDKRINRYRFFWVGGAAVSVNFLAWIGSGIYYINVDDYKNVFLLNGKNTIFNFHSQGYIEEVYRSNGLLKTCKKVEKTQTSVILIVVESWSLHHSRLFSGLSDLTPGLDAIAKEGSWYKNYYSNGYSTETALIALLTGNVPIVTHRGWGLAAYDKVDQDAYNKLNAAVYETAFFTTGDLAFSNKIEWLEKIGVQYIEGAENAAYHGMRRGSFGAASDKALVDRFLSWYDNNRSDTKKPLFATMLNVGTHPPFIDADQNDPDGSNEIAAFKRADQEISRLIKELENRNFLENGIIFVVGDHRAMTPRSAKEMTMFGETSLSRVPAFALGATGLPQGQVDGDYQHTDILPSILSKVTGEECRSDWQGQIFGSPPVPPKVIIYSHPVIRDELRVYLNGITYSLKLDGDNTRWLGLVPVDGEELLRQIVRQRLSTDPENESAFKK